MKLLFDLYCGFIALQKTQYQDKQQEVSNINNYITYYTSHTFKKNNYGKRKSTIPFYDHLFIDQFAT